MAEHPVTLAVLENVYNRARKIAEATAQSVEQVLAQQLESLTELPILYGNPTREQLIEKLNNLRASGAFENVESLYGKYANTNIPAMSEEEFHAQLHDIATEWEQELDEFDKD